MTASEFLHYVKPADSPLLLIWIFLCAGLGFYFTRIGLGFYSSHIFTNKIKDYALFLGPAFACILVAIPMNLKDNYIQIDKLKIIETPYYQSLPADEKSYFKEALLGNNNVANFSATITMSELEKLVNQIEKRKREKLESYKLNEKSEYDNLHKKERIISLIKGS